LKTGRRKRSWPKNFIREGRAVQTGEQWGGGIGETILQKKKRGKRGGIPKLVTVAWKGRGAARSRLKTKGGGVLQKGVPSRKTPSGGRGGTEGGPKLAIYH